MNEWETSLFEQACAAVTELIGAARLQAGDVLVVGCSTSEVLGGRIGKASSPEIGALLCDAILSVLRGKGIYLAAQCCEHLNRAIIIEERAWREKFPTAERVNVRPQPKAGGSFPTAAWERMEHPVALESLGSGADAGMDIGDTLIGMHLRHVAVPIRLANHDIGEARVICARTRPKFIGGARAVYDEDLL